MRASRNGCTPSHHPFLDWHFPLEIIQLLGYHHARKPPNKSNWYLYIETILICYPCYKGHPFIDGFSLLNHPFWGSPIDGNHALDPPPPRGRRYHDWRRWRSGAWRPAQQKQNVVQLTQNPDATYQRTIYVYRCNTKCVYIYIYIYI